MNVSAKSSGKKLSAQIVSVALFFASIAGVTALTHWMPTSPLSGILADDRGGPGGGPGGDRQRREQRPVGDRGGHGSRATADFSAGALFESFGTLAPQAGIVGVFAVSAERSRRRRRLERSKSLGIQ
jgi:hypothetical protein